MIKILTTEFQVSGPDAEACVGLIGADGNAFEVDETLTNTVDIDVEEDSNGEPTCQVEVREF